MSCKFILPEREKHNVPDLVKHLKSEGFIGKISELSINILADFNLAQYYKKMGLDVILDLSTNSILCNLGKASSASLNVVENRDVFISLAKYMESKFNIPYLIVEDSSMGIEGLSRNLFRVSSFFKKYPILRVQVQTIIDDEISRVLPLMIKYRSILEGKTVQFIEMDTFLYINITKALRAIGLKFINDGDSILIEGDILVGGLEEESIANKLGIGFCCKELEDDIINRGNDGILNLYESVTLTVSRRFITT